MSGAYIVLLLSCMLGIYASICPPNESISECGTSCEPSCEVRNPNQTWRCKARHLLPCRLFTKPVCRCDKNFFRNKQKLCVPAAQCFIDYIVS